MVLARALAELPLIAILRGIRPDEAVTVGECLYESGFRIVEVPLNSPDALSSIATLSLTLGDRMLVGAGTVLTAKDMDDVARSGGRLIVSPNFNKEVVVRTKAAGLISIPGVATPTEAFAALEAGADALKLFPAEMISPNAVKAMRAVLPPSVRLIPVGGISAFNLQTYRAAGADAFGVGTSLYKPGIGADELALLARQIASLVRQ